MFWDFEFTVKNQNLPKCRIVAEFFYETPIREFFRRFQTNCTTRGKSVACSVVTATFSGKSVACSTPRGASWMPEGTANDESGRSVLAVHQSSAPASEKQEMISGSE